MPVVSRRLAFLTIIFLSSILQNHVYSFRLSEQRVQRSITQLQSQRRLWNKNNENIRGRLGHLRPRLWSSTYHYNTPTAMAAFKQFRNFEEMLNQFNEEFVLVNFSADFCGGCKLMREELNKVTEQTGDDVILFNVDTDKWPKLGSRYEIQGLPTIVFFKGGKVLDRVTGVESAEAILERLDSMRRSETL